MKVIYNRFIPFPGYSCINLFGVVFSRLNTPASEATLRHERIHSRQMLEMLIVGFYLWYLTEWLIRLLILRNQDQAYRTISFEREAYTMEHCPNYLATRKPFQWMKFLHSVGAKA